MITELVTIILPVKNHVSYIEERVNSILSQTLTDWKCLVIDGYSNDGSWQLLQRLTHSDNRFELYRREPKGVYDAWNYGIALAKGKYIYVATSDDSMTSDCLEQFVKSLENHPECGLAHCNLKITDAFGHSIDPNPWLNFLPQKFYNGKIDQMHIRLAPLDGILHCFLFSVYTSATQICIRRSIIERVGIFSTQFGPSGDFEWCMRASLLVNTVHIPKYLATWRQHQEQLTSQFKFDFYYGYKKFKDMCEKAYDYSVKINPELKIKFSKQDLLKFYQKAFLSAELSREQTRIKRILFFIKTFIKSPRIFLYYVNTRKKNEIECAKEFIEKLQILGPRLIS